MVEQCTVCLYCHFHGDLFSRFPFLAKIVKINRSQKNGLQYLHVYKRTIYRNRYKSNFTILFSYTVREIHQNTVDKIYLLKDYRYSNNDYRHLILTPCCSSIASKLDFDVDFIVCFVSHDRFCMSQIMTKMFLRKSNNADVYQPIRLHRLTSSYVIRQKYTPTCYSN